MRGRNILHQGGNQESDNSVFSKKKQVSKLEYMGIIQDILKMQKNLCLCRHFQHLNKKSALGHFKRGHSRLRSEDIGMMRAHDEYHHLEPSKEKLKEGRKSFLDVWLVDFFAPSLKTDVADTTSLFTLQLACIVNMVPRWKKLKIRVFLVQQVEAENLSEYPDGNPEVIQDDGDCDPPKSTNAKTKTDSGKTKGYYKFSIQSFTFWYVKNMSRNLMFIVYMQCKACTLLCQYILLDNDGKAATGETAITEAEKELQKMLEMLRIRAQTQVLLLQANSLHESNTITVSDSKVPGLPIAALAEQQRINSQDNSKPKREENNILPTFLKVAGELVRGKSSKTAVTFLYLPQPPKPQNSALISEKEMIAKSEAYLENLEELTNHWPPTLLVRGVSPVTSTTL